MHKNNFYISFGIWIVIYSIARHPECLEKFLSPSLRNIFDFGFCGSIILKKLQTKEKPRKKTEPPKPELKFEDNTENL